jgi:signal transduction histidine kinase
MGYRIRQFANGEWQDPALRATGQPNPQLRHLCQDRSGRLWAAMVPGGMYFFDEQGRWRQLEGQGRLEQGRMTCLFEDREGNVWCGTDDDGVYRLTAQRVTMLAAPGGSHDVQTTCAARDGKMWIGTRDVGLFRWQHGQFAPVEGDWGAQNPAVFSIFEDSRTNLWAGTSRGLFRLERGRFHWVQGPPGLRDVSVIFEDRTGTLWFGTLSSLFRFRDSELTAYPIRGEVRALAQDRQDNLWIATIGGGLFRLAPGEAELPRPITSFAAKDVRTLLCDQDGCLWIGTWGEGLFCHQGDGFLNTTTAHGLPSDRITTIISDQRGRLWFSSNNGIFGIAPASLREAMLKHLPPLWQRLSLKDGLLARECSGLGHPVACRTAEGLLWFPDYAGIAVFDPNPLLSSQAASSVLVETPVADGRELAAAPGEMLRVRSDTRRFEFHYTAPNLTAPTSLRFRYRLDGMDKSWVDAGTRRLAEYSQLRPGDYEFRVMAGGDGGEWSEAAFPLRLRVMPRLWERGWVRALAGALVVGLASGGLVWGQRRKFRWRLEQARMHSALEAERRRIAQDLHDDFGSALSGIMLQGEAAPHTENLRAPAAPVVTSMTEGIRALIQKLDEVVWATNPRNDPLARVVAHLSDLAEGFVSPTGIHFRLDAPVSADLPATNLTAQQRHNLVLATKETLNNAVRHAKARTIGLKIRIQEDQLVTEIWDDGEGFEPGKTRSGGNGLSNIQNRMEALKGSAAIRSRPDHGTTVTLVVPLGNPAA